MLKLVIYLCSHRGFYINITNACIFNRNEHFELIYCHFAHFACISEDNRIVPQLTSRNLELLALLIEYHRAVTAVASTAG